MIPIRDHVPSGRTPFITYILLLINITIFIYLFLSPKGELSIFITNNGIVPKTVISGENVKSLITSMFVHGSVGHIFGNMLFLNIFGDNLEDRFGHMRFALFYLLCGVLASLLQISIDPSSTVPIVGASGAIAGLMGGYLLLFPKEPIDVIFTFGLFFHRTTLPAYTMLIYWFVFQLLSGVGSFAVQQQSVGGVAYFAHIGGFISGVVLTKLLLKHHKA